MSPEVKEFIEKNIEHIDKAEFELLYTSLNDLWGSYGSTAVTARRISEFTETLLSAGIDPLNYLEGIPGNYLYRSTDYVKNLRSDRRLNHIATDAFAFNYALENVDVNVAHVDGNAFSFCINLQGVKLQSTLDIELIAFNSCKSLVEVELPKTLQRIKRFAFSSCDNLKEIKFNGTMKEWSSVILEERWAAGSNIKAIKCTDGSVVDI